MMRIKNVKTVKKSMKNKGKNVKTFKSKKEKEVEKTLTVNGRNYVIPDGWDLKKCLKVNHLELPVVGLSSIWLPVTQVEQYQVKLRKFIQKRQRGYGRWLTFATITVT